MTNQNHTSTWLTEVTTPERKKLPVWVSENEEQAKDLLQYLKEQAPEGYTITQSKITKHQT